MQPPIVQAQPMPSYGMGAASGMQAKPVYFQAQGAGKTSSNLPAILCGVFVVVVVVIVVIIVLATQGSDKCDIVELGKEIREGDNYVGIVFSACPSEAAFAAFLSAAARWSSVVVESKIPPFTTNENFGSKEICGTEKNVEFKGTEVFDHLVIVAETVDIDGVGSVLAQAGPCLVNLPDNIPFLGLMQFDNADLASLEADGTIEEVITHEMGHVLGLGTLWVLYPQGGGPFVDNPPDGSVFPEPVFDPETGGLNPNRNSQFLGTNAIAEFQALGDTRNFVPVEDDGGGRFNPAQGQGQGSIDGHWDIDVFDQELMVFAIDSSVVNHPLSKVSIASLADIGYTVNLNVADNFVLPNPQFLRQRASLRGADNDAHLHKMVNDIYRPPASAFAFNKAMQVTKVIKP